MNHRIERYLLGRGINTLSFILLFSFITVFSQNAFSQNLISRDVADYPLGSLSSNCSGANSNDCIIILPPAKYGESYSFTVPLKSTIIRSEITFNFTQNTMCSEGSIVFTPDGKIEITALSSCRPEVDNFINIDLVVTNNSDGSTDKQKLYLPVLRDPVKIALVLDKSASMSLPIPGGSDIRWQVLKNAVELFVQKLEVFGQGLDMIGANYISSDVVQPESQIGDNFVSITSESDPIRSYTLFKTDLASKSPSSMTAIGKAILDAKEKLNAPSQTDYKKIVLLFTDGMQNTNPIINIDGRTLNHGNLTLNDCPCTTLDSIRYYTIGLGGLTLVSESVAQIASSNGGVSMIQTVGSDESEIMNLVQDQLIDVLNGSVPQIVSRETGMLSNSGTTFSYPITGNVSKLYFEFLNPDATAVNLKLEKDGKDLTSLANVVSGSFYKTVSLALPVTSPELVPTEGDWKLTITGNSSKSYTLTCFVNSPFVNLSCKPQKEVCTVGDVLSLNAKVTFAGKPIEGTKVEVAIVKPGDDLGDLLSSFIDTRTDSLQDVEKGAQTKFVNLVNNKSFLDKLKPKKQMVSLSEDVPGLFTGQYKNTDVTGVYQLIYIVNGQVAGFGKFARQKQYSVTFKFGQIDAGATIIDARIAKNSSGNVATINIKPKNKFGYLLGPGYLSRIKLDVDSKQGLVKPGKDNLDGSYTYTVVDIPSSIKPDVTITVMDEILYQGKFPTPKLFLWHYLVLIFLVLLLILRYVFAHAGKTWFGALVWFFVILWVVFMILHKLGVIHFL